MSEFAEQLRRRFNSRLESAPPPTAFIKPTPYPPKPVAQESLEGFTFDQYDGGVVGFYVEIEGENQYDACARLKDLVSEQEPIEVPLGTINGKPVVARVVLHPDGVRPGYVRNRRRW